MTKEVLNSKYRILELDEKLSKLKKITGLTVQSLLFDKDKFTTDKARMWAKEHGFRTDKVDITENKVRLRQKMPSQFKDFRTISFSNGIKAVVAGNMKSKFVGSVVLKGFSKFSNDVKSEMDLKIPLEVELLIIKEGANRDGYIRKDDLEESLELWSKPVIIDFHDMEDMKNPSQHKISDRKGFLGDKPQLKLINGEWWVTNTAYITDRYLAYLIYLNEERGKPLEISPEFGWVPFFSGGIRYQTMINPHLISIVDKGHIEGNQMKIKV